MTSTAEWGGNPPWVHPSRSILIGGEREYKGVHLCQSNTMDRAEKRKQQQREYYHRNIEQLRAKAKIYRDQWTDEQKQRKRERDLAYYHRTKALIARKRKSQRRERTDDQRERERQQRRVRNKTDYAREKHREHSKKFYNRHWEAILNRQRQYYRNHAQAILKKQKEYKQKREARKWEPLHLLTDVCQRERDGMCSGNYNNASMNADVNANTISPSTLPCIQ